MSRERWIGRVSVAMMLAAIVGATSHFATGCNGWDPSRPFERNAPEVDRAIGLLDAGDLETAEQVLTQYLESGICQESGIELPEAARKKADGSFDLGLVLFYIAEKFGAPFGKEEDDANKKPDVADAREREIVCALAVARAIANDPKVPAELRARAHYLSGNLEFLREGYDAAVRHYDEALKLIPGLVEEAGGDGIGRDAAHNRAIALRRLQDKQDASPDAGADGSDGDDGNDGDDGSDGGDAGDAEGLGSDGGNGGNGGDAGDASSQEPDAQDGGGQDEDAGPDAEAPRPEDEGDDQRDPQEDESDQQQQAPAPGDPEAEGPDDRQQQDRILDEFEEAPTYQEKAKKRGTGRGRTMEDK